MSKIVRLKPKNDIVSALEDILERAKAGEIQSFMFGAKCTDGCIATSWGNADVGDRQELVSHLQVDVTYAVIESNIDRLIEYI